MPETELASWQAQFFVERVCSPAKGKEGVYFREQVFGALDVLSEALPDLQSALGEQNFRFFVRELLAELQPREAFGTSLIEPFLGFLLARPELSSDRDLLSTIRELLEKL